MCKPRGIEKIRGSIIEDSEFQIQKKAIIFVVLLTLFVSTVTAYGFTPYFLSFLARNGVPQTVITSPVGIELKSTNYNVTVSGINSTTDAIFTTDSATYVEGRIANFGRYNSTTPNAFTMYYKVSIPGITTHAVYTKPNDAKDRPLPGGNQYSTTFGVYFYPINEDIEIPEDKYVTGAVIVFGKSTDPATPGHPFNNYYEEIEFGVTLAATFVNKGKYITFFQHNNEIKDPINPNIKLQILTIETADTFYKFNDKKNHESATEITVDINWDSKLKVDTLNRKVREAIEKGNFKTTSTGGAMTFTVKENAKFDIIFYRLNDSMPGAPGTINNLGTLRAKQKTNSAYEVYTNGAIVRKDYPHQ